MMKLTLQGMDVRGKRVLTRVDFNVRWTRIAKSPTTCA